MLSKLPSTKSVQKRKMALINVLKICKNLTEDVLIEAYRARTSSSERVRSAAVERAAPPGQGLLSAVYRLRLRGNTTSASFIAKVLVSDPLLRRSLNCDLVFLREIQFFSKVLPALIDLQKSLHANEKIQHNIPICYSCHYDGSETYILMEDMAESNCTSISENPTEYDRDLAIQALAHLHAVSMALRVTRPEVFFKLAKEIPESYYTEERRTFYSQYLKSAIDIDRETLAEFEDTNSLYFKKFDEFVAKGVFSELMDAVTPSPHAVFCHGDTWCPNFLAAPGRAVALDFQLLRCGSPATDLSLFVLMCGNLTRTKEDFLKSFKYYHNCVDFYLKDMGIEAENVFSWKDLMDELKRFGKYGLGVALSCIPLAFSDKLDYSHSFEDKYSERENIPLEELWPLTPFKTDEHKMRLVNAVRIAVDVGLI